MIDICLLTAFVTRGTLIEKFRNLKNRQIESRDSSRAQTVKDQLRGRERCLHGESNVTKIAARRRRRDLDGIRQRPRSFVYPRVDRNVCRSITKYNIPTLGIGITM